MRIHALLLALALALVGLGCSSTPKTTEYLLPLDPPAGAARVDAASRVGLGRVAIAPYLDADGIVVQTAPHAVHPARFHRWAEPLDAGLRRFLRAEISKAAGFELLADTAHQGRWDRTIDVSIDRLHGDLSGQATLVAHWAVAEKGGPRAHHRFSARQPLARSGYDGLVDAQVTLLRQLASAIAASLR